MVSTVERMNASVYEHKLLWGDVRDRVASDEGISREIAAIMVAQLITKVACTLPVAVAIIHMVAEKKGREHEQPPQCTSDSPADPGSAFTG